MFKNRLVLAALAGALLVFAIVAAGCGGESAAKRERDRQLQVTYLARGIRALETKRNQAASRRLAATCRSRTDDGARALRDLDASLNVGMTYDEYEKQLTEVSKAVRKFDPADMTWSCIQASNQGSEAFENYLGASEMWGNCLNDPYCDAGDALTKKLQAKWDDASTHILKMNGQLASLGAGTEFPKMNTAVPRRQRDVSKSIYGHAQHDLCGSSAPVEAVEPCLDLKTVLSGGVSAGELETLESAVARLNQVYHFAPVQKN